MTLIVTSIVIFEEKDQEEERRGLLSRALVMVSHLVTEKQRNIGGHIAKIRCKN